VRTPCRDLRKGVVEQLRDGPLAFAEHVAREGMRIDLDKRRGTSLGHRQCCLLTPTENRAKNAN